MTTWDNGFWATDIGTFLWDFHAGPSNDAVFGFVTGGQPGSFSVGGYVSGWYWGVSGFGGSPDDKGKQGPELNQYSRYAGVFGTGVYVPGVSGISVNDVGVYGQFGELEEGPPSSHVVARW
jgi:hypothetical protein